MSRRVSTVLGSRRACRIAKARTLSKAMDAVGLDHFTNPNGKQSMFWVAGPQGSAVLTVIEELPAGRGWTLWMQPPALGLKKEREWKFQDRTSAVAWLACAVHQLQIWCFRKSCG